MTSHRLNERCSVTSNSIVFSHNIHNGSDLTASHDLSVNHVNAATVRHPPTSLHMSG